MKRNKFSELSAICFLIKELQKKAIYGIEGIKKGDIVYEGTKKLIITSNPGRTRTDSTLFVQCDMIFQSGSFLKNQFISLCDKNVINGGYNLYRIFKEKSDSELYNSLINSPLLDKEEYDILLSNSISAPYFEKELYKSFPISIV